MKKALCLCLVALSVLLLYSCDNSLDPFIESKGAPYSIYGYLDINSDINYIRVKNLDVTLQQTSVHSFNGTVTLTNLDNGTSQVLQDSVVVFDGVVTHNFKTTMDILPLTTYQVKAVRKDGRKIAAKTITPNHSHLTIAPVNQTCGVPITFTLDPVAPNTYILLKIGFSFGAGVPVSYHKVFHQDSHSNEAMSFTITPQKMILQTLCGEPPYDKHCELPPRARYIGPPPPDLHYWGWGDCFLLHSNKFTLSYKHFGADPDFEIDKGFSIPGGVGILIGVGIGSKSFTINKKKVKKKRWLLTIKTKGNGSVVKDPRLKRFYYDTRVKLTAIPDSGWKFVKWTGRIAPLDTMSTQNPLRIIMYSKDKTITAHFKKK